VTLASGALEVPASAWPLVVGWVLLAGAVVGSFLNVVIARVPAGESVVRPRSRCPRCGSAIAWYDNVPVLSWIALRARCRSCGGRISARYPAVELLVAGAAYLAVARHGLAAAAPVEFAYVALVVALAFIDLDTWLLPNVLTWPLLAAGLAAAWFGLGPSGSFASSWRGAALGFGAFFLLAVVAERLLKQEALGFGDVWLLGALGAWQGAAALLPIVLLASLQGSIVGVALVLAGRAQPGPQPAPPAASPAPVVPDAGTPPTPVEGGAEAEEAWVPPRHAVPFGPFLVAGALQWLYLGPLLAGAVPLLRLFR
jgi:leader peptidase (prepilin peptidase)/N-methyltransferase